MLETILQLSNIDIGGFQEFKFLIFTYIYIEN